jgi:UDP-3-O-[3-hydroxymyristoyl] glucosamine N-acyltransferase
VEIGANTAIDRGTLADTVIEDEAKIDNLVHVAHNCHIKRGAFVIATSILCGGVVVGERAWVAPNASILEQITIGDDATVGLAATVIRDVEPGAVVVGSPARPLGQRPAG